MTRVLRSFLLVLAAGPAASFAQDETAIVSAPEAVESYLADLAMDDVLALHLEREIARLPEAERLRPASALGKLYAKLLTEAKAADERARIESAARRLLDSFPQSEAYQLRVDLAKAAYLKAEAACEEKRLLLGTPADAARAEAELRACVDVFSQVRSRLHADVERLEAAERRAGSDESAAIREDLAEARRLRSLAAYYEAWSRHYLGWLHNDPKQLNQSLEAFGVLLNAVPGKPPSADRVSKAMFKYEHVGRAALGCAMNLALLGDEVNALRWLDMVETAEESTDAVDAQLFARRLIVLSGAQRWADADALVTTHRRRVRESGEPGLAAGNARLVVVLALAAARSAGLREGLRTSVNAIAQTGLADLVARGELGQVVDLVQKFGSLPIGDQGFVGAYVRGLEAYEQARAAHAASGAPADKPAGADALVNAYTHAADLFADAANAPDAAAFGREAARVAMRRGLALYYAGDARRAAEAFEKSYTLAEEGSRVREDALWFAIVALDLAASDKPDAAVGEKRDRLAVVHIGEFPGSPNSARLLTRHADIQGVSPEQSVEVLLRVRADSPTYLASRREASRLLFRLAKGPGPGRALAAQQFVTVTEDLVRLELDRAAQLDDRRRLEAGGALILRVRQLLDVLLSQTTPDLTRAEAAMDLVPRIVAATRVSTESAEPEFAFRRFQIALARGDAQAVRQRGDELRALGGSYAGAADQLLLKQAIDRWRTAPADARAARDVVAHGQRVLDTGDAGSMAAVRNDVAEAAASLWRSQQDRAMRDLAIRLDTEAVSGGLRTAVSLRRLAELREASGDQRGALAAWEELLAGLEPETDDWYRARVESLRLLLAVDPPAAADAIAQFKILYPRQAPEPWAARLLDLEAKASRQTPPAKGGG